MSTTTTQLLPRQYYDDGTSTSSSRTTLIIIIVVILVVKICLIAAVCYYRNKKKSQRAARGCHCFSDTDYYCLPWWYWSSDSRCHCGAMDRISYNTRPPAYSAAAHDAGSGYSPGPYPPARGYPPATYASSPQTEAGQWNSQQQSVPLKPAEQAYINGRYY